MPALTATFCNKVAAPGKYPDSGCLTVSAYRFKLGGTCTRINGGQTEIQDIHTGTVVASGDLRHMR